MGGEIHASAAARADPFIGRRVGKRMQAFGHFEPSLRVQFLPKCWNCGGRHPLAYRPPLEQTVCPDCGARASAPPPAFEVPAILTGGGTAGRAARVFLAIGKALMSLRRRL